MTADTDPRAFALARLAEEEADAGRAAHTDGSSLDDPRLHWIASAGVVIWASPQGRAVPVAEPTSAQKAVHIARQDPAATLARVAALRALVEPHSPRKGAIPGEADVVCKRCFAGEDMETEAWPCEVIRGIAAIWPQDGEVVKL